MTFYQAYSVAGGITPVSPTFSGSEAVRSQEQISLLGSRARKLTKHCYARNEGCATPRHCLYFIRRLYRGSRKGQCMTLILRNLRLRKTPRENCN